MWLLILPLLWSSYIALRYAKNPIDPDRALFMVWGMTGAPYGKGFVDTKTPGIHLWYLMLTKIAGRNVARVTFAHHFMLGAIGSTIILLYTGDILISMSWAILINSGWLFAFHGNVGALAALLILPGILGADPWLSCSLMMMAVFVEPKVLPGAIVIGVLSSWWIQAGVLAACLVLIGLVLRNKIRWDLLIESSITIPGRILKGRRKYSYYPWVPYFTAQPLLYILPLVIAGVWSRTDLLYWLPIILIMIFQAMGMVLRPNHFLLIVAWVVLAPIPPTIVLALMAIELLTSGFYLGDIWQRWAPELQPIAWDVMDAGKQIKNMEGSFYATGMWASCLYVWAQKTPYFALITNIEVRETAHERMKEVKRLWKTRQPQLMATTPKPLLQFQPTGFVRAGESKHVKLWARKS